MEHTPFKGMLCEVIGGSAFLLSYSVGAMTSCNYIPQIMLNNILLAATREYHRI